MNVLSGLRNSFSRSSEALPSADPPKPAVPVQPPIPEQDRASDDPTPADSSDQQGNETPVQNGTAPIELTTSAAATAPASKPSSRRWSLQRFVSPKRHAPAASETERHARRMRAATAAAEHAVPKLSFADRRAHHDALVVRALLVGTSGISPSPAKTSKAAVSKSDVSKTKAALLQPREANKVIAQLRKLPSDDASASHAPIHAVCLQENDADADAKHFHLMRKDPSVKGDAVAQDVSISSRLPSISFAALDSVAETFRGLELVSLVTAPDFGLGQPGDGNGILSGALPTAETIINGAIQITPQLMSLGYATGRAIVPNHTGVYPPTDRMSVLTCAFHLWYIFTVSLQLLTSLASIDWWGLELVMPEPTMSYLDRAQSVSHTMMNFLSALALVNGGVREILPFVRYISQFIEWEFSAIKGQDMGQGVVCAATWYAPKLDSYPP
jgi:hypothetical protein